MITKSLRYFLFFIFSASLILGVRGLGRCGQTHFITIGSGDPTGVYFPAGQVIAGTINEKRDELGIRASVESTPGSLFNLTAILTGNLEFGLLQSDKQYHAVAGLAEWAQKGPQKNLRSVFSLHNESVCLLAASDTGITNITDLKGKRVNLGHPRAAEHMNAVDTLKAVGIHPSRDIAAQNVKAADAPRLLQDMRIDAFFSTRGHPNDMLKEAVSGSRKIRFIPLTGPGIDKLVSENNYYQKSTIPIKKFYADSDNSSDVESFGVLATLCTSADIPDDVVYRITKIVFSNLEYFKKQHPAFSGLTRESMLMGLSAPLHPGARKYYLEAGLLK